MTPMKAACTVGFQLSNMSKSSLHSNVANASLVSRDNFSLRSADRASYATNIFESCRASSSAYAKHVSISSKVSGSSYASLASHSTEK